MMKRTILLALLAITAPSLAINAPQ